MFKLYVKLECPTIYGLKALDWRRAHGFGDGTSVYASHYGYQEFEVDEEFARKWFGPEEMAAWVVVGLRGLEPGEYVEDEPDSGLKPNLTKEQAVDLFIKAREERERERAKPVKPRGWFWWSKS